MEALQEFKYLTGALFAYCAYVFTMFVHEAGHAVVATLIGFHVTEIEFGPFQLCQDPLPLDPSIWNFRVYRRIGLGGFVRFHATSLDPRYIATRFAIAIAAGPLANFAFGGLALMLASYAAGRTLQVLGAFVFLSGLMGTINLFPFKTKRGETDGLKLLKLCVSSSYRKQTRGRLLFIARIHKFVLDFMTCKPEGAERELGAMKEVADQMGVESLHRIVDHLQEHLNTREPMLDCKRCLAGGRMAEIA